MLSGQFTRINELIIWINWVITSDTLQLSLQICLWRLQCREINRCTGEEGTSEINCMQKLACFGQVGCIFSYKSAHMYCLHAQRYMETRKAPSSVVPPTAVAVETTWRRLVVVWMSENEKLWCGSAPRERHACTHRATHAYFTSNCRPPGSAWPVVLFSSRVTMCYFCSSSVWGVTSSSDTHTQLHLTHISSPASAFHVFLVYLHSLFRFSVMDLSHIYLYTCIFSAWFGYLCFK